jgi:hypothetical protein
MNSNTSLQLRVKKVYLDPDNIETLECALISKLDEFLFTKNILTDYPTKKLIANGMVNQIVNIHLLRRWLSGYPHRGRQA